MYNDYYSAIVSQIERATNEFYICFVIIMWYIGSAIGCAFALHLHSKFYRRRKGELVLVSLLITRLFQK